MKSMTLLERKARSKDDKEKGSNAPVVWEEVCLLRHTSSHSREGGLGLCGQAGSCNVRLTPV